MKRRSVVVLCTLAFAVGVAGFSWAAPAQAGPAPGGPPPGSFALSGQAARDFQVPADAVAVRSWHAASGATATRYQQVVDRATVLGAQITVIRDAGGTARSVVGAYFPGLRAKGAVTLSPARARQAVEREIGSGGRWRTQLRLDPATGARFYEVQSLRDDSRPVRWIDAATGGVRKAFDAIVHGDGIGVKGDTKTVDSRPKSGGGFELVSPDERRATYDAGNKQQRGPLMTDADDHWDLLRASWRSPDQRPGVDAHQYADVVDDFYADTFQRDSIDDAGMQIISTVHFANRYCNASRALRTRNSWSTGT